MSQPDYDDDLVFESDMTFEDLIRSFDNKACTDAFYFIMPTMYYDIEIGKDMVIRLKLAGEMTLGKFKSYRAIKRAVEAILEGVER